MGRSTVDKLPSGRFRARYEAPTGRWISKTFDRKEAARRWLRDELGRIDQREWTDLRLRQVPVADWAERWERSLTDLKPKTRVGYQSLLRTHVLPHLGAEPLNAITPSRVQEWIGGLEASGLSPSRIRQARQVLGAVYRAAIREGLVTRDPTEGTRLPRQSRRRMVIIAPDQLERLIGAMATPDNLITLTLAYTGIRWGEMAALRVQSVNLANRTMHITESLAEIGGDLIFDTTKTHRDRTVAVPGFLAEQIAAQIGDEPHSSLLFTSKKGRPLRLSNWRSQVWRPAVKASKTSDTLRPHDLRHFCASVLIQSGASPVMVARQLGHSSPRVTLDVYSHLFPTDLDTMADRLDIVRRDAIATHARHEDQIEHTKRDPKTPESPDKSGDSEGSGGET